MSTTTLSFRANSSNALPLSYDTNTLGIVIYPSHTSPFHTLNAFFSSSPILTNSSSSHRNGFSFMITTPIVPLSYNYPFPLSTLSTFIAKLQFV